jgi:hypothetical protein
LTRAPVLPRAAVAADRMSSSSPLGSILSSLFTGSSADESADLQKALRATDEEWSIIYPELEQIVALRAAVEADGSTAAGTGLTRRFGNGPMGGSSMDVPTMAGRGGGRYGGRVSPFDPSLAPGGRVSGQGAALTRGLARNWANSVKTGQGNSVLILLNELQSLLDDENSTDNQLFDKLNVIRAARAKATCDLDAAQSDLKQLLTIDQLAVLVSLGYID